ncbi:MAG: RNA polymerase sigma-70 factor [Nakamurella sp.]
MSDSTFAETSAGGIGLTERLDARSRQLIHDDAQAEQDRDSGPSPGACERSNDDLAQAATTFAALRPRLFGIAYRMLASSSDAEDVVQEAWVRWQNYQRRGTILDPAAFLSTITTRLSINVLQSAHARRETYIGPWLPEPVDTSSDPALGAERGEALGFAVLLLLEKLTPTERAAYILREAFDYPYRQIADTIEVTEQAARQLVSRGRKHLTAQRRSAVDTSAQRRLLEAFLLAAQSGNVAQLEELFSAEVVSYSDGNGVKLAARIPVSGRSRVAKFVAAFSSHFWTGKSVGWVELNGQPAVTLSQDGVVTTAFTVTASADGIEQLLWLMNPAKLGNVQAAVG